MNAAENSCEVSKRNGHRSGERGTSTTEYVLVIVLIAVACIGLLGTIGNDVKAMFETTSEQIDTAQSHSSGNTSSIE